MPSWKKLIISGSDAAVPSVSTTGDFTIDASGDIVLDADGADILLKDGGIHFGSIKRVTSDLVIKAETSNKHMLFKGSDGGTPITALDLDMENAGNASFNNDVDVSGALTLGTALAVAEGGTGATSLTSNSVLTGNGTSAIQAESTLTWAGTYLDITSNDGAEGGIRLNKSTVDGTHTRYHISHRDDNQSLIVYSYDGTTYRNWITLDEPNARLRLGSSTSAESEFVYVHNGRFGVGTQSPNTKLHVAGTISGSQIESSGDVIAYSTSDRKFKDNIQPISEPLYKLSKVGGYTFDWNDKQKTYEGHDVGVIAQEIQEVLPEVVTERENGLAVKYEKIVPLLIESIKELKQEVDEIKQKCDCLNK